MDKSGRIKLIMGKSPESRPERSLLNVKCSRREALIVGGASFLTALFDAYMNRDPTNPESNMLFRTGKNILDASKTVIGRIPTKKP